MTVTELATGRCQASPSLGLSLLIIPNSGEGKCQENTQAAGAGPCVSVRPPSVTAAPGGRRCTERSMTTGGHTASTQSSGMSPAGEVTTTMTLFREAQRGEVPSEDTQSVGGPCTVAPFYPPLAVTGGLRARIRVSVPCATPSPRLADLCSAAAQPSSGLRAALADSHPGCVPRAPHTESGPLLERVSLLHGGEGACVCGQPVGQHFWWGGAWLWQDQGWLPTSSTCQQPPGQGASCTSARVATFITSWAQWLPR